MNLFRAPLLVLALVVAGCSSDGDAATDASSGDTATDTTTTTSPTETPDETTTSSTTTTVATSEATTAGVAFTCEEIAAQFVAGPSVNPELADPESSATCDDGSVTITSNGIPDYTYIQTSPGDPRAQEYEWTIPAAPTAADAPSDVAALGPIAVSLGGVPIYGATEGTGGDVLSLEGALSECGSHNGPTGFHIHLIGTSDLTDCIFTPQEIATAPQLLGYAFDGYPIYTGNDQYTSSWQLTNETLFATDTWSAHTYVEGSGDLDQCNGRTDQNGNYAYYTTNTFPYTLGCYTGTVDPALASGPGGRPPRDG